MAALISISIGFAVAATAAEQTPPAAPAEAPVAISEDVAHLLELGKMLMGQNNPEYAVTAEKLTFEKRNDAGQQALRTLRTVVKRSPQFAQGWLWLGIALTETLVYTKNTPQGHISASEANITEGVEAYRSAYQFDNANEDCVKYYGDALQEYKRDFDGAIQVWKKYLPAAHTDMQRVMALVQTSRAFLNKAYFGKDKLRPDEVKRCYQQACDNAQLAAKTCPNAQDVKEMLSLLREYRKPILGK